MGDISDLFQPPPYWLVHALTWPARIDQSRLARAALVWVPPLAGPLPRAAQDVRYVADAYCEAHGGGVIFFSDLDAFLDEEGTSWRERRTEPGVALDQTLNGDLAVPGLLLLISWYAHQILASSPRTSPDDTHDGATTPTPAWEREAVRQAIALQLAADWPAHIRRLTAATPPQQYVCSATNRKQDKLSDEGFSLRKKVGAASLIPGSREQMP